MRRLLPLLLLLAVMAPGVLAQGATAQDALTVTDRSVQASFPDHLAFRASAESDAEIVNVRLRYTILPDGTAAVGEAEFQPGTSISAVFELQSSDQTAFYLPPGTTIEYHWEVTDAAGRTATTEEAVFVYVDDRFAWQTLEGAVTVLYYSGSEADAARMQEVAAETISSMSQLLGTTVDYPVKVWIYDSVEDMRPALQRRSETYEQSVITAGVRVASDTVLVLGNVSFDTLRHELTHVVTHVAGESALGTLPAWLDEGTAVYGQSDPEGFAGAVERAIDRGEILSVRSITSYPGDPDRVNLFYGESWSLVSYLVETYGEQKFAQLFAEIKSGKRIDSALQAVYGFTQDGLEDEWRAFHGLPPRVTPSPAPPADVTPTAGPDGAPSAGADGDGGTSTGVIIAVALGTILLAAAIGAAGLLLARRVR